MKKKSLTYSLAVIYSLFSLYLLIFKWNDVQANLEASFICFTPAFVTSHVILHKKITKLENKNDTRADS